MELLYLADSLIYINFTAVTTLCISKSFLTIYVKLVPAKSLDLSFDTYKCIYWRIFYADTSTLHHLHMLGTVQEQKTCVSDTVSVFYLDVNAGSFHGVWFTVKIWLLCSVSFSSRFENDISIIHIEDCNWELCLCCKHQIK